MLEKMELAVVLRRVAEYFKLSPEELDPERPGQRECLAWIRRGPHPFSVA
jgi:hypothetical protein